MNRQLLEQSKFLSIQTIKENFLKVILIIAIAFLPIFIAQIAIAYASANLENTDLLSSEQLSLDFLNLLILFAFYPITIKANFLFYRLMRKKEVEITEIFENYSSLFKIIKSLKILVSCSFRGIIRILPNFSYIYSFCKNTFICFIYK